MFSNSGINFANIIILLHTIYIIVILFCQYNNFITYHINHSNINMFSDSGINFANIIILLRII